MAADADRLLAIVGDLHEGVVDDASWARAFGGLCDALDDPFLLLASRVGRDGDLAVQAPRVHMPPEVLAMIAGPFGNAADNPWLRAAQTVPLRRMVHQRELGPGVMEGSKVWREICTPFGITSMAGAVLERQPGGADTICFGRARGQFVPTDIGFMTALLPHIARAWRVRRQVEAWRAMAHSLAAVLDRLERGVVVTDGDGRVRFANRSADRLLSEGDSLDATRGRLRARRPQDSEALRVLIARAARTGAGADTRAVEAMAVPREDARPPVAVVAEPLAPAHADALEAADAGAILFLSGAAEASRPPAAHLRIVYGLTPAEADVAAHIASGDGVQAAATVLRVSEKTVKAHLTSIFGKVGVTRQAQLVRRVMADLGGLAPDAGMPASASNAPTRALTPPD